MEDNKNKQVEPARWNHHSWSWDECAAGLFLRRYLRSYLENSILINLT